MINILKIENKMYNTRRFRNGILYTWRIWNVVSMISIIVHLLSRRSM